MDIHFYSTYNTLVSSARQSISACLTALDQTIAAVAAIALGCPPAYSIIRYILNASWLNPVSQNDQNRELNHDHLLVEANDLRNLIPSSKEGQPDHVPVETPPFSPIATIPEEMLMEIFSFFSPNDLASVCCVCTQWNRIQRDNALWKRHQLAVLDGSCLDPSGSWYQSSKIIQNWQRGRPTAQRSQTYLDPNFTHFTTLDDRTVLAGIVNYAKLTYKIRNLSTHKTREISLREFNIQKIDSTHLDKNTLTVLDGEYLVSCFDVATGQRTTSLSPPLTSRQELLSRNIVTNDGEEILSWVNRTITRWDAHTGSVKQTLNTESIVRVALHSTPHHIIYISPDLVVAISKDHQTRQEFITSSMDNHKVSVSAPYIAMIDSHQPIRIKILEESLDGFAHTRTIDTGVQNDYVNSMRIYKNWLLVDYRWRIEVWNMKTGEKLSTVQHHDHNFHTKIHTNGKILLMASFSHPSLIIYNFDEKWDVRNALSECYAWIFSALEEWVEYLKNRMTWLNE